MKSCPAPDVPQSMLRVLTGSYENTDALPACSLLLHYGTLSHSDSHSDLRAAKGGLVEQLSLKDLASNRIKGIWQEQREMVSHTKIESSIIRAGPKEGSSEKRLECPLLTSFSFQGRAFSSSSAGEHPRQPRDPQGLSTFTSTLSQTINKICKIWA